MANLDSIFGSYTKYGVEKKPRRVYRSLTEQECRAVKELLDYDSYLPTSPMYCRARSQRFNVEPTDLHACKFNLTGAIRHVMGEGDENLWSVNSTKGRMITQWFERHIDNIPEEEKQMMHSSEMSYAAAMKTVEDMINEAIERTAPRRKSAA